MIGPRASLASLASVALVTGPACVRAPSDFGRACSARASCDEGALCVDGLCVPPHEEDGPGESCALPLALAPADGPRALGRVATSFGAAKANEELAPSCTAGAGARDIVVSFSVAAETGVRVRATAAFPVGLALRVLADGACEPRPGDRCAGPSEPPVSDDGTVRELLVPRIAAGTHAVIVSATAADAGAVIIEVEELDCPVGYLPLASDDDDDVTAGEGPRCVGWREIERMPVPGLAARAVPVPGGLLLVGGRPPDAPDFVAAFFDVTTESWSFVQLFEPVSTGDGIALADGTIAVLGHDSAAGSLSFQTIDPASLLPLIKDEVPVGLGVAAQAFDLIPAENGAVALTAGARPRGVAILERVGSCSAVGSQCPAPYTCVPIFDFDGPSNVCMCLVEPCGPPPLGYEVSVGELEVIPHALEEGYAFAELPGRQRTLVTGFIDAQTRLFDGSTGAWALRPNLVHRAGASLVALDEGRVAFSGGLDASGSAAAVLDIYDVDNGALRSFNVPAAARVDHTATPVFERVLLLGGRSGGALARATLVDPVTGRSLELEDLPEPRVDHVAIALDGDRVLVAGGSRGDGVPAARSFVLERVRAGRPDEPAPESPPEDCDFITELAFEDDDEGRVAIVEGTTAGRHDEVRTDVCEAASIGQDAIYRLRLDGPSRVLIEAASNSSPSVWIARGPCREGERVDIICTRGELDLLSFDAGEYLIVVEAGFFEEAGGAFTLTVRLRDATDVCAGDDADPGDDEPAAPRRITSLDTNGDRSYATTGALCPGDVDHVLLEHTGGVFLSGLTGIGAQTVDVIPADADLAASAAALAPVVIPRFDLAVPLTAVDARELPLGLYVFALRPPGLDGVTLRPTWSFGTVPSCPLDPSDSLIATLDDALVPQARRTLAQNGNLVVALCHPGDVDVVPLVLDVGGDLLVTVGRDDALVSLHAIDDEGGLGPALPAVTADGGVGGIGLRLAEADRPARIALRLEAGASLDNGVVVDARLIGGAGDTCTQAVALTPDAGALAFSTSGFIDDVDASFIGDCTGFRTPGLDSFYAVELATGDTLTVDAVGLGGDSPDVALFVIDACPPVFDSCLAGVDTGFTLDPEHLEFTNAGPPGTFFLVVDSFFGTSFDVELTWSVARP